MALKLINNTFAQIREAIAPADTTLWLMEGQGAQFDVLGAGGYFYITLPILDMGREIAWEVMKVTSVSGDFLAVVRAQDGTTAKSFDVGARVEARINKAAFDDVMASKVDSVAGKQLSDESYTLAEKNKLEGVADNATANSTDSQLRDRSTHIGTQGVSTITGLGTAATSNVTTSATDTTADRLLKVGDFGFTKCITTSADLDSILQDGVYDTAVSLNRPENSNIYGYLRVYSYSQTNDFVYQEYNNLEGANKKWFRTRVAGVWGSWQEVYHAANIVGTVSQLGGAPTGAIIERGVNVSGSYAKYACGTLICWMDPPVQNIAISSAFYGGYRSPGTTVAFPHAFVSVSELSHTIMPRSLTGFGGVVEAISNTSITWGLTSIASSPAANRGVSITLLGRWY